MEDTGRAASGSGSSTEGTRYLKERARIARDGELSNVLGSFLGTATESDAGASSPRGRTVQEANDHAAMTFVPLPYAKKVTLFKPRANYSNLSDALMGWGGMAKGGIEVVELPVNPHGMLVASFVQHLASEILVRIPGKRTQ